MPPPSNVGPDPDYELKLKEYAFAQYMLEHPSLSSLTPLNLGPIATPYYLFEHHFDNVPPGGWFGGPGTQGPDPIPIQVPDITSGPGVGYHTDRPNTPIVKGGSMLPGQTDTDTPREKLKAQTPKLINKKSCPDAEDKLKDAWADAMQRLNVHIGAMKSSLSGCNSQMDSLLDCLSQLPNTGFSKGDGQSNGNQINIRCVNSLGQYSGQMQDDGTLNIDMNVINDPKNGSNPDYLASTLLHEMTHNCGGNTADELTSKWIENIFYGGYSIFGWPRNNNFPIGIGSSSPDPNSNNTVGEWLHICCESKVYTNFHPQPKLYPGIVSGNLLGWDTNTGELFMYCDDGSTKSIDFYNPFQWQGPPLDKKGNPMSCELWNLSDKCCASYDPNNCH
jgi:hypothetical protein